MDDPPQKFHVRTQELMLIAGAPLLLIAAFFVLFRPNNLQFAAVLFALLALFSALGGLLAARGAHEKGLSGGQRTALAALGVIVANGVGVWLFLLSLPTFSHGPMHGNETAAQAACKAFAEAQELYHRTDYKKSGTAQYAPSIAELYETAPGKADLALMGKEFVEAEGSPGMVNKPRHGYCFKVLLAQGSHAIGGAKPYMVDGKMTGGYAMVAYPARWDETGRNSFMINNSGTIFQKDLDAKTPEAIGAMIQFDPDSTWTISE